MTISIDHQRLLQAARNDRELTYKLRAFTGAVRISVGEQSLDLSFEDGGATEIRPASLSIDPLVAWRAPDEFWANAFAATPMHGYESLTTAPMFGLSMSGDFGSVIAPWQGGLARLYQVLRETVAGPIERKPFSDPYRDTDNPVGRYVYVTAEGVESRVYFETAGHGPTSLMLQATAGADSRQYRHMLADPRMQDRFTMYAYDLPFHGRSLPPQGVRWWEQAYKPTQASLIEWVVAIKDAIGLDQPFFLGCSVGGQLALDLAAERPDDFGAFISVNGWYGAPEFPPGFSNDLFRTPPISTDLAPQMCFGATAPMAPEVYAHETYWVYRSAFPGIYAGDNDYFGWDHDLAKNGHKIDAVAKPVYVVTGEWDPASDDEESGGPAVARKIPGAKFVKLMNLGHFAPCDDPIGFQDGIMPVLDEILKRVSPAALNAEVAS
ncbi:alpha/beta fold hydrolase [Rhodococcoides fascians]|uniref:alpha/beta fold hydrolase n=1 Tax=Rhodococcoides fascians TaxID=1828 RepID=UPI0018AFAE3D|nr:alpha/beta hydrolase [Rhodococcus fascians]